MILLPKIVARTRIFTWKWTHHFIKDIPKGSTILDIGCGNGRNLCCPRMIMYGIDISLEQLKNFPKPEGEYNQGYNLVLSNMIAIPYRSNIFHYIIVIASFHHLTRLEDRRLCLFEMKRVSSNGVNTILYVWSINQPKNTKRTFTKHGDTIVSIEVGRN